jgi:hypothetical protein
MKTIFIPDRWVKFIFNNEICIGITFLQDGQFIENEYQLVFFLTKELSSETIEFSECIDLRYLSFVKKTEYKKDLKVNNEMLTLESQVDLIISPVTYKNTTTILAKNQCNHLFIN